jgi:hypothetical protein
LEKSANALSPFLFVTRSDRILSMPELTISLTHEEYTDLERIAEERLQDPEQTAHDLLVEAIADALDRPKMSPEQRAFNRGVLKERRAAVQATRKMAVSIAAKAVVMPPTPYPRAVIALSLWSSSLP